MKITGIYKITSPSGRVYIGQSTDCMHRKSKYSVGNCKKQHGINRSILKHGWDNHTFEIIHECSKEELNDLEKYYISFYNSFNSEKGLNLTSGGRIAFDISDESRKKIGKASAGNKYRLGKPAWNKGVPMKEESKTKMIKAKLGKSAWNKGIKQSEEQKQKISLANLGKVAWNKGKPWSEEVKAKVSKTKKEKPTRYWLGKKRSEETILKMIKTKKEKREAIKNNKSLSSK